MLHHLVRVGLLDFLRPHSSLPSSLPSFLPSAPSPPHPHLTISLDSPRSSPSIRTAFTTPTSIAYCCFLLLPPRQLSFERDPLHHPYFYSLMLLPSASPPQLSFDEDPFHTSTSIARLEQSPSDRDSSK